jgi:NADH-quinone oxidoreductase subunit H
MLAVSLLGALLFFGGWNGPIPVFGPNMLDWSYLAGDEPARFSGYLANLFGMLNILLKGVLGVTVMMWVRWTLPRLRIDQVMKTCLKYCTPIAAVMFVCVVLWQYYTRGSVTKLGQSPGAVRESFIQGGGRVNEINRVVAEPSLAVSPVAQASRSEPR